MPSIIEVDNLRKSYKDDVAVEEVSFSLEEGEIFGIIGPNGAGKTTTVECLQGLRRPDEGGISVPGLDPRTEAAPATPADRFPTPGIRIAGSAQGVGGPGPVRLPPAQYARLGGCATSPPIWPSS